MSNIKYLHFNNGPESKKVQKALRGAFQSRTVAVETVDAEGIVQLAKDFVASGPNDTIFVTLNVGVTLLGRKDDYNRKVGRHEAISKMKKTITQVVGVNRSETHLFVKLAAVKGVTLNLRLNLQTGFTTVTGSLPISALA